MYAKKLVVKGKCNHFVVCEWAFAPIVVAPPLYVREQLNV